MKEMLKSFREDFNNVMKELQSKYGFDIQLENITYASDGKSFSGKIEAIKVEEGKTREQVEFEDNAKLYGFEPSDYRKEYIIDGVVYQLVGFNRKARKNSFIIKDVKANKEYTCDRNYLNNADNSDMTEEEKEEQQKKDFSFYAFRFGFKPTDYNKEYTIKGTVYQLVGFKPRATKNPIVIKNKLTGEEYVCSKEFLEQ